MCKVRVQFLARIEAGKGAKSRFLWNPSVSLSQYVSIQKIFHCAFFDLVILKQFSEYKVPLDDYFFSLLVYRQKKLDNVSYKSDE